MQYLKERKVYHPYHKYSRRELNYIKQKVLKNPANLSRVFEQCALKFNVTAKAISEQYYAKIAPTMYEEFKENKANKLFILTSKTQIYPGYKNDIRGRKPSRKHPINKIVVLWNRFIQSLMVNIN